MADFPTSPGFNGVKITSYQPSVVSTSISGKRKARIIGGHRWLIEASFPAMYRSELDPVFAFLMSEAAQAGSFTLLVPTLATPKGMATGTPLVKGASQTGTSLITDGWTINQTGILKAGDILTIAGDTKVYTVTADANSNGTGDATLSIQPTLQISPADNAVITVNNCLFTVAYAGPEIDYSVDLGAIYAMKCSFIEAL